MNNLLATTVGTEFQAIAASPYHAHRWFELFEAIRRWQAAGADEEPLFNFLAAGIAECFHVGKFTYGEADSLANELTQAMQYGFYPVFAEGFRNDALWWRVYLAFDDGEFRRGSGEDPLATYTRPQIVGLVGEIRDLGGLASILSMRSGAALSLSEPAATFEAGVARTLPQPPPPRRGPYRGRRGPGRE